jgi:ribonuclease HI
MGAALKGANAELWREVWQVLRSTPGWTFEWLPSHRSEAEATAAGLLQEDWQGNEKADAAAKALARAADVSPELLSRWTDNQAAVEAVCRLIAESGWPT